MARPNLMTPVGVANALKAGFDETLTKKQKAVELDHLIELIQDSAMALDVKKKESIGPDRERYDRYVRFLAEMVGALMS